MVRERGIMGVRFGVWRISLLTVIAFFAAFYGLTEVAYLTSGRRALAQVVRIEERIMPFRSRHGLSYPQERKYYRVSLDLPKEWQGVPHSFLTRQPPAYAPGHTLQVEWLPGDAKSLRRVRDHSRAYLIILITTVTVVTIGLVQTFYGGSPVAVENRDSIWYEPVYSLFRTFRSQ